MLSFDPAKQKFGPGWGPTSSGEFECLLMSQGANKRCSQSWDTRPRPYSVPVTLKSGLHRFRHSQSDTRLLAARKNGGQKEPS